MSSPPNNNERQSPSQPMVQTILESFTRCFNPALEPCTKVCTSSSSSDKNNDPIQLSRRSPSPLFGLNLSSEDSNHPIRAVSRSISSSNSKNHLKLDVSYDADGVASAKRSANNRMTTLSREAMEERSLKRKLEIFRGSGSMQHESPRSRSSSAHQHKQKLAPRRTGRHTPPPSAADEFVLSDDEEELIRLTTSSRRRFACGLGDRFGIKGSAGSSSPISSVARLFNLGMTEAQKPFGLCFATPVRSASHEDLANLSDHKLTDDEFLHRHTNTQVLGGGEGMGETTVITPHDNNMAGVGDTSYCEEETINSTLYFESKYSHLVQTRPPMPLFQDDLVNSTRSDDLTQIINRRSGGNKSSRSPPIQMVTSKTKSNSRGTSQGSSRGSPFRGGPSPMSTSTGSKGGLLVNQDEYPPSPVKIRDESLSLQSTNSIHTSFHEELNQGEDVLNLTAAEF